MKRFIISFLIGLSIGLIAFTATTDAKIHHTKAVCDKGHSEISAESEELCGRLQDETHTQYLCNKTGNVCWLEVK